ncbi:MAG: hypothetical protein QF819_04330 [Gemmatimonadota bacterium]|jgi:alkylhydroperoxidase family enzyme|nr:hypothetical protein [Gemmatimonadota bacterium]MDP6460131.1 hypothetical protein [Gemmatimonadota bacterium]MDP6528833.1 hypothetical protein [Gemmatimonadota bacterium]MDP6802387.1 hypothetical protein [Gemmatimonadota bacterium]MDP7031099.1 hypothetical protein [Gemmatimonadota bacterium]
MPWIAQVEDDEAAGLLKKEFDDARRRSGRVWNIVRIMSANPRVLSASIRHYAAIMLGSSPLSRVRREMLATVVASEVGCRY